MYSINLYWYDTIKKHGMIKYTPFEQLLNDLTETNVFEYMFKVSTEKYNHKRIIENLFYIHIYGYN